MPSLPRLALALAVVAALSACQPEPEAKYAKDLNSCELLPREVARKVTDVGPKLGPAEEKTWNFIVTFKYCQWRYGLRETARDRARRGASGRSRAAFALTSRRPPAVLAF